MNVATPAWWYEEPEYPERCRCEVCTDAEDGPGKCAHRRVAFLERDEDGPVFRCLCCEEVCR